MAAVWRLATALLETYRPPCVWFQRLPLKAMGTFTFYIWSYSASLKIKSHAILSPIILLNNASITHTPVWTVRFSFLGPGDRLVFHILLTSVCEHKETEVLMAWSNLHFRICHRTGMNFAHCSFPSSGSARQTGCTLKNTGRVRDPSWRSSSAG